PPVRSTARGTRPGAGPAVPAAGHLPAGAEPVPSPLLGSPARGRRVDGCRDRGRDRPWPAAAGTASGDDARVARDVGPLSVDREHWPDVLQLRLGDAPPGGGIPGDLPGQRLGCAALAGYPPVPL